MAKDYLDTSIDNLLNSFKNKTHCLTCGKPTTRREAENGLGRCSKCYRIAMTRGLKRF